MRARTPLSAALLAPAIAIASVACAPGRTLGEDETRPVRIGLIVPLMGELGADGPRWRDAVVLAVREVNAAGGVLPARRVELVVEDGESTPEGGLAAYRRLRAAGVVAILGDAASSATIGIYRQMLAEETQVPLVSGLSTSVELTRMNEALDAEHQWFFRTVPPDDAQAPALARAMYEPPYACRRIAILYADNDYGRPFASDVQATLEMLSPDPRVVVIAQPYTEARSDYMAEVMAVAAAMPDCIALIAYPQSAGVIINQWHLLGSRPSVRWFGTDGVRQPGFAEEVGDETLIDGFLGTSPVTDAPTPAYNRFARNYAAAFGSGEPPVAFSSNLYDAAALIMLAIAHAGTDDPDAIRRSLYLVNEPAGALVQAGELAEALRLLRQDPPGSINYEGASGSVNFDAEGNVMAAYELWRYDATQHRFVRDRLL